VNPLQRFRSIQILLFKCADLTSLLTLIQEDIHKKLESIDKDSLESSKDVISQIIEGMLIYLCIYNELLSDLNLDQKEIYENTK